MKTKTLTSMVLSGKNLAVVVKLSQTISETNDYSYQVNDYSYQVMVKETRNSFNRDNRKYIFNYYAYRPALDMYLSEVEQFAHHIAIMSL